MPSSQCHQIHRPDEAVSAIAKAARVLRSLASADGGGLGLVEMATEVDLPKSTTHRVLAELMTEGLVGRQGLRYRLGPSWFALQTALASSEWVQLADRAREPLASLFGRADATVHLAVLDGSNVRYLEKLTGRGGCSVPTRVGSVMPATCTAVGKSLLAFAGDDVVEPLIGRPLPMTSTRSIRSPERLLRQLGATRATGIAYDLEESRPGLFCVAAPVLRSGRAIAAVSVSRINGRGPSATDEAHVRRAADEIAEWLDEVHS